jgi:hypothetical protein
MFSGCQIILKQAFIQSNKNNSMKKIISLTVLLLITANTLLAQSSKQKVKQRKPAAGFQEISGIGMETTTAEIKSPRDASSGKRKAKSKHKPRKKNK